MLRSRARDLGIVVGELLTGTHNALTDIAGVRGGAEVEGVMDLQAAFGGLQIHQHPNTNLFWSGKEVIGVISRKTFYLCMFVTVALLIGDLAYRVYTRPQEFPYDLLLVMAAITILGLSIMMPELAKDKDRLKRWAFLYMPACLLGGLTGLATEVVYEYASGGTIRWGKHLSNLYSMLAAFVIVLVVGLVVAGIIRARSKG